MFLIETSRRRRDPDEPIVGLRDFFTVHGAQVLNVNTAPKHVLQALFEAAGRTDGDRAAENVIRQRRGSRRDNFDNDKAFKSTEDIQASSDIGALMGPMMALYPLGVTSTVFTVDSTGEAGNSVHRMSSVVSRRLAEFQRDENFEMMDRAKEKEDLYEDRRRKARDRDSEQIARIPLVQILEWKE
jgi:type II secretory pathway component PulK